MPLCILLPPFQAYVFPSQFLDPAKHISASGPLHLLFLLLEMSSLSLYSCPFSSFRSELTTHLFSEASTQQLSKVDLLLFSIIHTYSLDSSKVYNILFLCIFFLFTRIYILWEQCTWLYGPPLLSSMPSMELFIWCSNIRREGRKERGKKEGERPRDQKPSGIVWRLVNHSVTSKPPKSQWQGPVTGLKASNSWMLA